MIRQATIDDLDFLIAMGENFYNACGFPAQMGFDPETLEGVLRNLIVNDSAALFVDEKLRGCIGGIVYPYYFTGQLAGNEMFWWVEPEYRGKLGSQLITKLEDWAREKGAISFTMIALEASNPEKMAKVYEHRGYEPRERHFVRYL